MFIFLLILSVMGALPGRANAQGISTPSIYQIIEQIEVRRGTWTGFKADLTLQFSNEQTQASCQGRMTYHRLDEKILLHCFDDKQNRLFTFRTEDLFFELYLPSKKSVVQGSIFDLEEAANIEMHLKPMDLYRTLKPMAITIDQTLISEKGPNTITLNTFNHQRALPTLEREILVTEKGDVPFETFYSVKEEPTVIITRFNFKETDMEEPHDERTFIYPRNMMIESLDDTRTTELSIRNIRFYTSLDDHEWQVSFPPDTEWETIKGSS